MSVLLFILPFFISDYMLTSLFSVFLRCASLGRDKSVCESRCLCNLSTGIGIEINV